MAVDPELVPWDRIVHWYGRATEVPDAVRRLGADDHEAAERFLLANLEHQDGVIQATPPAVRLLLRALREGAVRDPSAVRRILQRIEAAARFKAEVHRGQPAIADWSLYSEERLWPDFESEEEDEALWEQWAAPDEEWLGWSLLTLALLQEEGGGEPSRW
jgi:hypothetical protein